MKRKLKPVVHDALRLGLQFRWNQQGDDALRTIGAVAGVDWRKIKRFIDGDDAALSGIEWAQVEALQ